MVGHSTQMTYLQQKQSYKTFLLCCAPGEISYATDTIMLSHTMWFVSVANIAMVTTVFTELP